MAKIITSPAAVKFGTRGAKLALLQIKKRRQRRIDAGQRVAGQKVRDFMIDRGIPTPLVKRTQRAVRVNTAAVSPAFKQSVLVGTDQSFDITAGEVENSYTEAAYQQPLIPSNPTMFAKLSTKVAAYQFYKWKNVKVSFAPALGYAVNGNIAFCVVPSYAIYAQATNYTSLTNVQDCAYGAVNTDHSAVFGPRNFDASRQRYQVVNPEKVDPENVDQSPAFLQVFVEGLTGLSAATVVGKITISYSLTAFTETIPDVTAGPQVGSYYNATPFSTLTALINKHDSESLKTDPMIEWEEVNSGKLTLRFKLVGRYLIRALCSTGATTSPSITAVAGTHAAIVYSKLWAFTTTAHYSQYVVDTSHPNATVELTQNNAVTAQCVDVSHFARAYGDDLVTCLTV